MVQLAVRSLNRDPKDTTEKISSGQAASTENRQTELRAAASQAIISTTQRYRHLDDRELADAQDLIK